MSTNRYVNIYANFSRYLQDNHPSFDVSYALVPELALRKVINLNEKGIIDNAVGPANKTLILFHQVLPAKDCGLHTEVIETFLSFKMTECANFLQNAIQQEIADNFRQPFKNRPLTIVAIGKTGKGKSATLNTILKSSNFNGKLFPSKDGPNAITGKISTREFTSSTFSRGVRLVDTVGLFDPKLTRQEKDDLHSKKQSFLDQEHQLVLTQFNRLMNLCNDGIDAFFFVFKALDRVTLEELETIEVIFRYLGSNMLDHVIFVITGKNKALDQDFKDWKAYICQHLQKRGYNQNLVEDKFIFFDNKKNPNQAQIREMFSLIAQVQETNQSRPYNHIIFQNAQKQLDDKNREIKLKTEIELQLKISETTKSLEAQHQADMIEWNKKIQASQADLEQMETAREEERRQMLSQFEVEKEKAVKQLEQQSLKVYEEERKKQQAIIDGFMSQKKEEQDRQVNAQKKKRPWYQKLEPRFWLGNVE